MSLPDSQKIFKIFHSSVRGEGLATGPLRYTSSKNRRPRGLQYCLRLNWTLLPKVSNRYSMFRFLLEILGDESQLWN